jgi:Putative zinc-finger
MNSQVQHEIHPDADHLNAFAERALGERERSEVLAHLAVCGRCRQIVALAQEAAEAEAATAVAIPDSWPVSVQSNAWWMRWRFVWVPTAVVAALVVASISIYIRQAQQHDANLEIAEQMPAPAMETPSTPAPAAKEASPPAASPASAIPEKKTLKSELPDSAARQSAPKMPTPPPPAPEALDHIEAQMHSAPPPAVATPGSGGGFRAGGGLPAVFAPSAVAKLQAEEKEQDLEKQQAEAGAEPRRLFAAKAPLPTNMPRAGSSPPAASQTVQVMATPPALETQNATVTSFGALKSSQGGGFLAVRRLSAIQLPGGLPVVSAAFAGRQILAIDQAGALYLSEDSGNTWTRVAHQWSGRAVEVRRQALPKSGATEAPHAAGTGNATPAAAAAPGPANFELVTSDGRAWLSTDGRTWKAK